MQLSAVHHLTIDEDTYTFISSDLNDEQPSIQFNEVGTYEVTLTTYNTVGADDSSITIVVYDEPTALFTSNKTVYDLGDELYFKTPLKTSEVKKLRGTIKQRINFPFIKLKDL